MFLSNLAIRFVLYCSMLSHINTVLDKTMYFQTTNPYTIGNQLLISKDIYIFEVL